MYNIVLRNLFPHDPTVLQNREVWIRNSRVRRKTRFKVIEEMRLKKFISNLELISSTTLNLVFLLTLLFLIRPLGSEGLLVPGKINS